MIWIPIGRSIEAYINWYDHLVNEKVIKDEDHYLEGLDPKSGTAAGASFIIELRPGTPEKELPSILRLRRGFGLGNIFLLDLENKPMRFQTVDDFCEYFYHQRLPYYQARKDYMLKTRLEEIKLVEEKIRYLEHITSGKIVLFEKNRLRSKQELTQLLAKFKFAPEMLKIELTSDKMAKFQTRLAELKKEYEFINSSSSGQLWLRDLLEFEKAYDANV